MRGLSTGLGTFFASTWLTAALAATAAPHSYAPQGANDRQAPARPQPLAGLDCASPLRGHAWACSTPDYDVTGFAEICRDDSAAFGVVVGDTPLIAHDRLTTGSRPSAIIAPGQFVCIQFHATPVAANNDGWVYIVAIAPALVPSCRRAYCGRANAGSRWIAQSPTACVVHEMGYSEGCPAGWVSRFRIDEFSMGLSDRYAEPEP